MPQFYALFAAARTPQPVLNRPETELKQIVLKEQLVSYRKTAQAAGIRGM